MLYVSFAAHLLSKYRIWLTRCSNPCARSIYWVFIYPLEILNISKISRALLHGRAQAHRTLRGIPFVDWRLIGRAVDKPFWLHILKVLNRFHNRLHSTLTSIGWKTFASIETMSEWDLIGQLTIVFYVESLSTTLLSSNGGVMSPLEWRWYYYWKKNGWTKVKQSCVETRQRLLKTRVNEETMM